MAEFGPEKNLRWKVKIPSGASSPVICGERLFLTGYDGQKLFTFCLSTRDGRELWRAEAPAPRLEPFHQLEGNPAASSVATDGERVIAYFGSCGLLCYDLEGKEQWRVAMPVAETDGGFGSGTSPVLDRDRVFLVRDLAKEAAVYCFDAQTGRQRWKTERPGFSTSYSTPLLWRRGDVEELVVGGSLRLKSYDPATGRERWTIRNLPCVNCTSPVADGDLLYFGGWVPAGVNALVPDFAELLKADTDRDGALSEAEAAATTIRDYFASADADHDGRLHKAEWDATVGFIRSGKNGVIAVKASGTGDLTDSHVVWRTERGLPYVPTPLAYQGRLYLLKDGGLASCVDAATGRAIYSQKRLGLEGAIYASPIAADGRIYGISLQGVAFVYAAGDQPTVLCTADLGERTNATPAVADGVLYYRTASTLWAFGENGGPK